MFLSIDYLKIFKPDRNSFFKQRTLEEIHYQRHSCPLHAVEMGNTTNEKEKKKALNVFPGEHFLNIYTWVYCSLNKFRFEEISETAFLRNEELHFFLRVFSSMLFLSVQFSRSVMFNSLQPHGLQHVRLPCPSPIPGAYSNSCPLSQ